MALSTTQYEAIQALASIRSVRGAARRVKVSRNTLFKWLGQPEFARELEKARRKVFHQGLRQVQAAVGKAAQVMVKLLDSPDDEVKLKAAKEILTGSFDADVVLGTTADDVGDGTGILPGESESEGEAPVSDR